VASRSYLGWRKEEYGSKKDMANEITNTDLEMALEELHLK